MRRRPFTASSHLDLVAELVPVGGGEGVLYLKRPTLRVVDRPQDREHRHARR